MGRTVRQWWRELGPGGASTFSLAIVSGLLGLGLPVAHRMRAVFAMARLDERSEADAVLVLGRSLADDLPSEVFRARLDHGARLFRDGLAPQVVISGGRTGSSSTSEAQAGRDYLLAAGLPGNALHVEDRSRHTLENLYFVRETARAAGWRKLLLVTDPLHLARAATVARGLGLDVALSGAAAAPPRAGSVAWLLRAVREGYLLHWYFVGLAYSKAIGSRRLLGRVT